MQEIVSIFYKCLIHFKKLKATTESIEWFIEGQALAPPPLPTTPPGVAGVPLLLAGVPACLLPYLW